MNTFLLALLSTSAFAQQDPADAAEDTSEESAEESAEAAPTTPDRSAPPAVQPPVPLELPEVARYTIRPGLVVEHLQVPGVRKVQVQILFHHGSVALCGEPNATCRMVSEIWDVASTTTSAVELESQFDQLDGGVVSWLSTQHGGIDLSIPRTSLDDGLALLDEVLHNPGFPKSEFKLRRDTMLDWYQYQAPNDPGTVARLAWQYAWYPADHPMGARADLEGFAALKPSDLAPVHQALITGAPATVLVVGDVTWEGVQDQVLPVLEGIGSEGPHSEPPPFTPPSQSHIVAVDMPGQTQAAIRALAAAPARGEEDQVTMTAVNFALGGSFTSRLNGNLREEKGWTYGAYSSMMTYSTHGVWYAQVDVESENVAATYGEIRSELEQMVADGATAEEISSAWLDDVTWWNRRLETDESAANFYQSLTRREQSTTQRAEELAALRALSPEQTQAAAERWLGPDAPMIWVIVGDRSSIGEQVDQLGLPVTWLTTDQIISGDVSIPR